MKDQDESNSVYTKKPADNQQAFLYYLILINFQVLL